MSNTNETKSLDWLAKVCDPDREQGHLCGQPWRFEFDGSVWSIATDGRAIAMVNDESAFEPLNPRWHAHILQVASDAKAAIPEGTVLLSRIKDWCRGCELYGECEECDGEGMVNECPTCGTPCVACPECGGDGIQYLDPDEGIIGKARINKGFLWRIVRHLGDGEMQIATNENQVALRDSETIIVVMGISDGPPTDDRFSEIHAVAQGEA